MAITEGKKVAKSEVEIIYRFKKKKDIYVIIYTNNVWNL